MQQASVTQEVAFRLFLIELLWWSFRTQVIPYIDELPPMERTFFDGGCRFSCGQPGVSRQPVGAASPHAVVSPS
jgi:hypothetical protein